MPRIVAVALVAGLCGAGAAVADADKIYPGRCHMDVCSWFSIGSKQPVASGPLGTLYKVELRGWSSQHPDARYETLGPLEGGKAFSRYVYCSRQKPTVILDDDGKWYGHILAPGKAMAVFGYNEVGYKMYFLACHGAWMRDPWAEAEAFGRRFGYPATLPDPEQIEMVRPSDILN